jgi:hypothetical protein
VPQRQDLDVLRRVGAGEQRQPAQHANEYQVDESEGHSERSCWLARDDDAEGWPHGRRCSGTVTQFSAPTGSGNVDTSCDLVILVQQAGELPVTTSEGVRLAAGGLAKRS